MTSLLDAQSISINFGGLKAVQDVSFSINDGEVFSIVGPNGAGKTTIFNLISRIYDCSEGSIFFEDQDITNIQTHKVAELGIARTFQNTELFEKETVLNNLLIGCHVRRNTNFLQEIVFSSSVRKQELTFRESVESVIDLLDLQTYREQVVGNLSYGARKMVEVARALCTRPKLLLLDEPSSGLNPEETEDLAFWIEDINEELGITIIMVEHDMKLVASVSDRVMAMADGRFLLIGTPQEVQEDPEVLRAYLGD